MTPTPQQFLHAFYQATPYIHAHRHKLIVIAFNGDINNSQHKQFLHDCALLHSLRMKVVLIHGARAQIQTALDKAQLPSRVINSHRVTEKSMMPHILATVGSLRLRIEAILSMGLSNPPMPSAPIRVISGNFLTAKPIGVIDGIDYGLAGELRHIDSDAIKHHLQQEAMVLISALGNSPTGEIYNLNCEEIAGKIAVALQADKLIYALEGMEKNLTEPLSRQLSPAEAQHNPTNNDWLNNSLAMAGRSCEQGIRRVHLLDPAQEGALLTELFTRDGSAIMVTSDKYDNHRQATVNDIAGLLNLIRPLEEKGILVKRSREQLECEIQHFHVLERDGMMIGCAALYPYAEEKTAELACVVIHPDYRQHRRADALLAHMEKRALELGLETLFILTTQTAQWFEERGFAAISIVELPIAKQQTYNYQRNSRPYLKRLV